MIGDVGDFLAEGGAVCGGGAALIALVDFIGLAWMEVASDGAWRRRRQA